MTSVIEVRTATARYTIVPPADGEPGTLTHTPGGGTPPAHDPEGWRAADLRRDGETVELLQVARLEVGLPALFVIRLYPRDEPALVTFRETTPVAAVEQLS